MEEIHQSKRVDNDDDGGGCVGGGRCRRCGHRSRDEQGRDGEAGIGVGDGVIGSRMREHPRGDDERGRSGRVHYVPFDKEVVALCSMVCCEE